MNLNHLKYFVDAATTKSVSQAAKKNFVTQSAVSRAIRKLEDDLSSELVVHKQNYFQLTEAGQAIYKKSREIFHSVDSLKDLADSYSGTLKGPLNFACNQAIASHLVGPLLTKIEESYPEISVSMKLGNTDQVQEMLDRRDIDFAIVLNDGEVGKQYKTEDFYEDQFIVVASPQVSTRFTGEDLLVSRTKKGGMSTRYFRAFKKAYGRNLTPKGVYGSWQVIMDLAKSGFGFALIPRFICEGELKSKQLVEVKHKVKPLPYTLCFIVNTNRHLPRNARALMELI